MKKDKLKKIAELANKTVDEGVLDGTFSISKKGDSPMGNGEIFVSKTLDDTSREVGNPAQRTSLTYPGLFLGLYEDSILSKDVDLNGDLIDDTHFENDDLVSSIENIVKLIPEEPKMLKAMYNVFCELITNLNIEELPQEARHKLCKKIMRKNSRLIDSF
jgi:hypothetical protein